VNVQLSIEITDPQRAIIGLDTGTFKLASREEVREWFEPILAEELTRLGREADKVRNTVKSSNE